MKVEKIKCFDHFKKLGIHFPMLAENNGTVQINRIWRKREEFQSRLITSHICYTVYSSVKHCFKECYED